MNAVKKRIDGWKSIAAFFKRDRTTVMRWAQNRNLPVHKVPGEGSTSVFAYQEELEAWLGKNRINEEAESDKPKIQNDADQHGVANPRRWARLTLAIIGFSFIIFVILSYNIDTKRAALPKNPKIADLYIKSREDWASRTADGLHAAVAGFETVIKSEPNFAPAHSSLSDAYLLVREFDATPDAIAYPKAEEAAKKALSLDKDSPEANRALGFIYYWWHRDIPKAKIYFEKSLEADNSSVQTHFWYGNALVDNGQFEKGLKELEKARLGEPGSLSIQADHAWALWSSGQKESGVNRLQELAARGNSSSPFTYLAYIALVNNDWKSYIELTQKRAELRKDPKMLEIVNRQKLAFTKEGEKGLLGELAKLTISDPGAPISDSSWPAALAALSEDRDALLRILHQADQRGEVWGFSGFINPVFTPWKKDAQISRLLDNRKGSEL